MSERERKPEDIETGERMASIAAAKIDALKHSVRGEQQTEHGERYEVDVSTAAAVVEGWPTAPKKAAHQMLEQYGAPNEATPTKLIWYGNGPWKRTIVTSDEIVHNFPTKHTDFLTQYIDYAIPPEKCDEIARFDGSCLVDRTAGEAAARCDAEAMNVLTLNLMHDIVTGARTVDDARKAYAENAAAYTMGRSAPLAERLQFEGPEGGAGDPDEAIIAGPMAGQMAQKARDVMPGTEGEPPPS